MCLVSALIIGSNEYRRVGRFLRFFVFFALLVAVLVLVVAPLALGPVLTQIVRNAGLQADTLSVSVAPFDPTLLLGKSRQIRLIATDVDVSPAKIGRVNLAVGDASYFDRSFQTVSGDLNDVSLTVNGTDDVHVGDISVDGPAAAANATAHLSATDTNQLIRLAGKRAGLAIDDVTVGDTGVSVKVGGVDSAAQLAVTGGALVLKPGAGDTIVLMQPKPSDPWSLQEAWVDASGLNVRALVDVTQITDNITGAT
jgi:hypothetical protein